MFICNQIFICQEIIGSQPSVLCTNGKVYQKIDFQLVWLFRSGIMRKNILVTHNYYIRLLYISDTARLQRVTARGRISEPNAVAFTSCERS